MTAHDLLNQRFSNGIMIEIHSGVTLGIIEVMKEFAKYHVEQALTHAYFEGKVNAGYQIEKDSIMNAYPLDLIK